MAYVLASIPLLHVAWGHNRGGRLLLAYVLLALPILPPYPLAHDWGRWANLHVTAFAFLLAALALTTEAPVARRPWRPTLVAMTALNAVWSFGHSLDVVPGGLVRQLTLGAVDLIPGH